MEGERRTGRVRVKVEQSRALCADEVVRGGRASTTTVSPILDRKTIATHPAIPTDCGSCRQAVSAAQYAGVTRSIPSLVPTRTKVGSKVWEVDLAILKRTSSEILSPSLITRTLRPSDWCCRVNALMRKFSASEARNKVAQCNILDAFGSS